MHSRTDDRGNVEQIEQTDRHGNVSVQKSRNNPKNMTEKGQEILRNKKRCYEPHTQKLPKLGQPIVRNEDLRLKHSKTLRKAYGTRVIIPSFYQIHFAEDRDRRGAPLRPPLHPRLVLPSGQRTNGEEVQWRTGAGANLIFDLWLFSKSFRNSKIIPLNSRSRSKADYWRRASSSRFEH